MKAPLVEALARDLRDRGKLDPEEAFVDDSFAPAKNLESNRRRGAFSPPLTPGCHDHFPARVREDAVHA
jgi:hypothetical protein